MSSSLRLLATGLACLWLLVSPAHGAAPAASAKAAPPAMAPVLDRALDDPRAAIAYGRQQLAASPADGPASHAFWLHLAIADVLIQTDQEADAKAELVAAARALGIGPDAERRRHWLAVYQRMVGSATADLAQYQREQEALRLSATALGDEHLLCTAHLTDAVVQIDRSASDEAWAALEATERCAARLGDLPVQTYALGAMGLLASRVSGPMPAQAYFERAIAALGDRSARYRRSWLLDDFGWALLDNGRLKEALRVFQESLALAKELGEVSSTMRGHEGVAEVLLQQKDATGALFHAQASLRLGDTKGLLYRPVTAQAQVVEAMALLRHPELAREVQRLQAVAERDKATYTALLISRSAARGYQAMGQHELAYRELERYLELRQVDDKARRDTEAQRMQLRYDAARREAENSELRRIADAARLELEVATQRQRAMLAGLVALSLLLAGGCWMLLRALRRRRRLADLALRDELTGLPNRRAVLAFAREQFLLAQRLNLPLSLALIDLDRFKQINDNHGHAVGDRALQAFGVAAERILRGQDRIGRWGGEEWLLVMPGTRADELATVFDRLRSSLVVQPIPGLPTPHRLTFSMGVAERQAATESIEFLIGEADRQLYRAKAQGRDALCGHNGLSVVAPSLEAVGRAA